MLKDDERTGYTEYVAGTRTAVRDLAGLDLIAYLETVATGYQDSGTITCDCGNRALTHTQEQLRVARKQLRSATANAPHRGPGATDGTLEQRVAELTAARDELKAEMAGTR
jgi:hypothetical protein